MKPGVFAYHRAATVEEAVSVLAEHGDDAKPIAGGQSLVPLLNLRLSRPAVLVDINRISGLSLLESAGGVLQVGALARHADVENWPAARVRCPLLYEALPHIGHVAIRNRGTIGGSIAHADPAAELPAVACALRATIVVAGPRGERLLPAEEFFLSTFTTAIETSELVVGVRFPWQAANVGSCWLEFARRRGDFALVGVAALVELGPDGRCERMRVACAGVAEKPLVAERETRLRGEETIGREFADFADEVAREADPRADLHGSEWYRRKLLQVLVPRALRTAFERARAA